MKMKCPINKECKKENYNAKSCLVVSEDDELNELIKNFFEAKGYGVRIKKDDFENAGGFCKFCESARSAGFGIVTGNSLFELGFLYGLGKPLILNNTPPWTRDTGEINNVVYLEKIDSDELKAARFAINETLKKEMAERFTDEKAKSYITQDVRDKILKLAEILLEHDFTLTVIRKHNLVEVSAEDKYRVSEIANELDNLKIEMTNEYYLNTGRFFFEINENKNAIKQFEKALEIEPGNVEALADIATSYYYLKKYEEAVEYFKSASEIDPENVYALHTMGMSYAHLKKYETAVEYFKKALKVKPGYEIYNDLGIVYNYLEDDPERYDKALKCFNESLKIKDNIRAWRNMGATYIHLEKYDSAIDCFKNALGIEPENAAIMSGIGGIYFRLKDYNNAIKYFKKTIDIEPNNAEAHHSLGLVYTNLKNYNEAIACFKRASDINPEYVDAWWGLGDAYMHLGDHDRALENFRNIVELDNEYVDAWNSMGAAYTKLGKYEKAGERYEKVVQILPGYVGGKLNLAENYIIMGKYDKAFLQAQEALKIAKENKDDRYICMSYFFGITSLLFQPQKISDGKVLINEFIKYFSEIPQNVEWDFSIIKSEIKKIHIGDKYKNLIYELVDLLQNKISVDDFVEKAKGLGI